MRAGAHSSDAATADADRPAPAGAAAPPECPRCGYGLTGQAQAWRDSCPLTGTCSECGLEFQWRDVLSPEFTFPKWCVEYGYASTLPRRVLRTLVMALRPRRFWRDLQMWHNPRWHRMVLLLPALLLLYYVLFAASLGVGTWQHARRSAGIAALSTPPWLDGFQAALSPWTHATTTRMGPMPATLRRNYQWDRIVVEGWQAIRGSADYFGASDGRDIIPRRAFDMLFTLVACPIGFVLLPVSRRIAKVRWRHVIRIAVYGLHIAMIAAAVDVFDQMQTVNLALTNEISMAMVVVMCLLAWNWWTAAAREYLRMPHARAIGLYVVVFAYLFQWLVWQVIDYAIVLLK